MGDRTGGLVIESARGGDTQTNVPTIPGALFVVILTATFVLVFGLMMFNGLVIQAAGPAFYALTGTMTLLAAIRYTMRSARRKATCAVRDFSEYCLLFMIISLLGVISTYPIAAVSSGFSDSALERVDELLRFDWVGWYAFVVQRPILREIGYIAYSMIYVSPLILIGYMAWHGQRAEARRFLITFWLAAVFTLLMFPLFPAKGPLAAVWTGPIPYMPTTALYQSEIIPMLRANIFPEIDLGALRGLVCAPSFHTVSGALYIAAAWPIARLRWPLVAMNAAMLLATPVEGNHYLTDMLLGLTVALAATVVVRSVSRSLVSGLGRDTWLGATSLLRRRA